MTGGRFPCGKWCQGKWDLTPLSPNMRSSCPDASAALILRVIESHHTLTTFKLKKFEPFRGFELFDGKRSRNTVSRSCGGERNLTGTVARSPYALKYRLLCGGLSSNPFAVSENIDLPRRSGLGLAPVSSNHERNRHDAMACLQRTGSHRYCNSFYGHCNQVRAFEENPSL